MNKPLSIIFGTPEHGWLSVDIISGDYKFNIDSSDVPVNPLDLLCDVLLDLKTENKGEVWWHLEPASVFLEFKKLDKNYQLIILTADRHEAPRTVEKTFNGNFQEIIEPFISALTYEKNTFASYNLNIPVRTGADYRQKVSERTDFVGG